MRIQLLFLLYYLAATEIFGGGISGSGPPMKRSYCKGTNAQLIIESQGTNESLLLNSMVIARASGMSGSGPPAQRIAIALNSDDFSEIRELIDLGKNLRIQDFKDWIEVTSADFDSENEQINMKLENHIVIQITSEDDGGIVSGSSGSAGLAADQGGISGGGPAGMGSGQPYESFNGGGGGTPTITDIDDGAAGGGGTIGDGGGVSPTITGGGSNAYGGTVIGTGSGGTLAECGISSGGDFISDNLGGSGVGGSGWKKDGGSMGGSTADADGIAVGGGTPYH